MQYYERIKDLRLENNLTQRNISKLLNVSPRTYADYETHRLRVPVNHLITLAKYYDCTMNYITCASNIYDCFPIA